MNNAADLAEHVNLLVYMIGALILALMGLLFWLLKKYSSVVDKHAEMLPTISSSLVAVDKSLNGLFGRLNKMDVVVRETEKTLNEIKGSHDAIVNGKNHHFDNGRDHRE